MRKIQQSQIMELLQTIKNAQSAGLYADCQDGALAAGEFIESIMGEGTRTVALLEEYCELLFKASNGEIGEKQLKKHFIQIENSVKIELVPDRIEIAFLSYNASMSDSIESIYLAAKDDPNCDAYWIPIPYFERNNDGSLGTMHFDGVDSYGENIECVDWQKYNIEARRPDVIFTFAPYDAGNYVTTVHPAFYCERLRGLTDLLVYVPYFVTVDDVPEHFCTVAGCAFAHKVMVQSEKIRDTYIRVFKETYGNKFGKPEEKFIALGSPKFDKTINTKREDCSLPVEWRDLIGDKKVIFYNTSVGSILAGNEQYLEKLRYVLDTFRSRDDVLLWWRPHPLNEATYKSMRPHLLDEYEQIIKDYMHEGWGIYDDSPDLHRAMSCSDAYYGDRSSLVAMYEVTGKISVIAYANIVPTVGVKELLFENLCAHENRLWFTSIFSNSLWEMDKDTWELTHIGLFPDEEAYKWRQFCFLVEANDMIYCIPQSAKNLVEYSPASNAFKSIPIPEPSSVSKIVYDSNSKFVCAYKFSDYLFITPYTYPGIVRYHLLTGEITVIADWITDLQSLAQPMHSSAFFTRGSVYENKLFLACCCANAVFEFDMNDCSYQIHRFSNTNIGYHGICYDGTDFWLSPLHSKGVVVKWNPADGVIKEFSNLCDSETDKLYPFSSITFAGGYVWLLPATSDRALKIDISNDSVLSADEFQIENDEALIRAWFPGIDNFLLQGSAGNSVYALSARTNKLSEYDTVAKKMRSKLITITPEKNDKVQLELYKRAIGIDKTEKRIIHEQSLPLEDYLQVFTNEDAVRGAAQTAGSPATAGADIYNYISKAAAL